jgi:hypothetical protein
MRSRRGASLAEMLVALLGTVLLGAAITALLTSHLRLAQHVAGRAETLDALHTSALLLTQETRGLHPISDIAGVAADSIAIRVFRGSAIPCGVNGTDADVRYTGARDPDPLKDSLLVITARSEEVAGLLAVSALAATGCIALPGETLWRIVADSALPQQPLLLFFERGSYHFDNDALRYRPYGGTRQPVTADAFDTRATAVSALFSPSGLALRLEPGPAYWLPARPPRAQPLRHRITFLNE